MEVWDNNSSLENNLLLLSRLTSYLFSVTGKDHLTTNARGRCGIPGKYMKFEIDFSGTGFSGRKKAFLLCEEKPWK